MSLFGAPKTEKTSKTASVGFFSQRLANAIPSTQTTGLGSVVDLTNVPTVTSPAPEMSLTQSTDYGSFPSGVNTQQTHESASLPVSWSPSNREIASPIHNDEVEAMDENHKADEDDTMTEVGANDNYQDMGSTTSSPLSSLESTPRQRPTDMFNKPGTSIVKRRYQNEVGLPETLKVQKYDGLLQSEGKGLVSCHGPYGAEYNMIQTNKNQNNLFDFRKK